MSTSLETAAARYDRALHYARDSRLPPDCPAPRPTSAWPAENVALLEQYREWLLGSGASLNVVSQLYLPMAGHVLGLKLKPHAQLDLETDLAPGLDYVVAKRLSAQWTDMCRNALHRFRRFLRQQRGQQEVVFHPVNHEQYCAGLPDWLVEQLERYRRLLQCNWRPARQHQQSLRFWGSYTRLWRWLFQHYPIGAITDIRRQYVLDYVDDRLAAGYAPRTINQDLRHFRGFLLHLQEQEYPVPQALLRLPDLKEPERLPRFLTDEQVGCLRAEVEQRLARAQSAAQRRDALLDRAAFCLMWQGGLRLGEVEELRLEDLDLPGHRLMVRQGKGRQDRAVYLTDSAVAALREYLAVRGMGAGDHVFLYRNAPLCKDLIRSRLKAAGERAGVAVTPHRLRHTCATQLLNAGCRITSIQKLLGHRQIGTTMIYARVHDHTLSEDYYAAMARIEKSLDLAPSASGERAVPEISVSARAQLLELVNRLAEPQLDHQLRLALVEQMRCALNGAAPERAAGQVC